MRKRERSSRKSYNFDDQLIIIKNFVDELFVKTMFQNTTDLIDTDLSPSQIKILFAFKDDEKAYPIGELGRNARIKKSTITYIIDRSEKDGIVERVRDSKDRRVVKICLTSKAKENKKKFYLRGRKEMKTLFAKLSNEEKHKLLRSLQDAYQILSKS
jgi:DNA-binding MarR family transcriptional regulator